MSAKARMREYLNNTKYATENLIIMINDVEVDLERILKELEENEQIMNEYDEEMRRAKNLDEFTYLREKAMYYLIESDKISEELELKKAEFAAKYESLSSLAGALLQIAKQGISIAYKDERNPLTACKGGKKMNSNYLKTIIWEGRNQSMHYEEGFSDNFPNTKKVFEDLEEDYNLKIEENGNDKINLAKEVVLLIGWKEYHDYKNDMLSLV